MPSISKTGCASKLDLRNPMCQCVGRQLCLWCPCASNNSKLGGFQHD